MLPEKIRAGNAIYQEVKDAKLPSHETQICGGTLPTPISKMLLRELFRAKVQSSSTASTVQNSRMASLHTLRKEIQLRIADFIPPQSIPSLALCCQDTKAAALEIHQKREKKYKRIANYIHNDVSVPYVWLETLLKDVYKDGYIAYHVRRFSLEIPDILGEMDDNAQDTDMITDFESIVEELGFGSGAQKACWKESSGKHRMDILAGLVFLRLPRLKIFEWRRTDHDNDSLFWDFISAASKSERLPQLESVIFKTLDGKSHDTKLRTIFPFIGISQSVQAKNCHWLHGEFGEALDNSRVSELGISLCEGNGPIYFEELLGLLPRLQRLHFEKPCACKLDALGFCKQLTDRGMNHLTALSVLTGQSPRGDRVGNFSLFPHLKFLRTHIHLLLSPVEVEVEDEVEVEVEVEVEEVEEAEGVNQQLRLPLSLEGLSLCQHPWTNLRDYISPLRDLVESESSHLPSLKSLDLTCQRGYGYWESYHGKVGNTNIRLFLEG